jgi:Zn-finger nucleic acid-binding protein
MERVSPDSGLPLQPVDFHGVRLDVCPKTGGIWFDAGEIARVRGASMGGVQELEAEVPKGEEAPPIPTGQRHCPNDASLLAPFYYAGDHHVALEACPQCGGVWADRMSLDNLAAHIEHETRGLVPATTNLMPPNLTPEAQQALSQMQMQHDAFMARAGAATSFFQALGSWWYIGPYWRSYPHWF